MRCNDCGNKMRQLAFLMSNPWSCLPRGEKVFICGYAWETPFQVPLKEGWRLIRVTSPASAIWDSGKAYIQSEDDSPLEFEEFEEFEVVE